MRKVFSVALMAAIVCLVGITQDAGATVTIDLIWSATTGAGSGVGTNTITASAGDVITLDIRMTNVGQTLGAHNLSLNFDTDLGNELNFFVAAAPCNTNTNSCTGGGYEWGGTTYGTAAMASEYNVLTPGIATASTPNVESSGGSAGRINTYESNVVSGPAFLPVGTYVIGTARFTVTANVSSDSFDVFSGLFNTGVDDFLDNTNSVITSGLTFNSASVNVIPEPGTASLLGLGLVGLVLAGRRSRRS